MVRAPGPGHGVDMATTTGPRTPTSLTATVLAMALVLLLLATGGPALASEDPAAALRAHINAERSARGLAPLASAADLRSVALDHSRSMASSGDLHHNPSLGSDVTNWRVVAENVGVGADADDLHREFMQSSTHAANILDGRVTQVGVGVVRADGLLWVTQVFRQPMSAPDPAPSTTPKPADTPAPDPASSPAPRGPAGDTPPEHEHEHEPEPEPEPEIGVAAATATRTAPVPATIQDAAAAPTTAAPAPDPGGITGLLATAVRWVADVF